MATLQPSALPSNPYDLLARVVRRHPFFLGALLIHGAVLWLVSHLHSEGQAEAVLRNNQAQIQAHTQAAAQHGMRRRVDSLKAMKFAGGAHPALAQAEAGETPDVATEPTPGASAPALPSAPLLSPILFRYVRPALVDGAGEAVRRDVGR
jgi:hypothetical protein